MDENLKHRLAALLSADVVGYSRLMAQDELATVRTLKAYRNRITTVVQTAGGVVVDFVGDNMLAEFSSALAAMECALDIQRTVADLNTDIETTRRMYFRIGIHLGDVMSDGKRLYGDGVNIAARLEGLAEPGGICISDLVYKQVQSKLNLTFIDLGNQNLKNIPESIKAYRLASLEDRHIDQAVQTVPLREPSLPLPEKPSLAVLPFVNLSNESQNDFFSDGLTMEIMTALVKIPNLFLISDITMFSYKSKPVSVREVGHQLGVGHVLEGGVQKAGDRIRITARLTEIANGRQVWAERFDRQLDDLFDVQDEIAEEIVTAMDVKLISGEPARTVRQMLKNHDAIESYYRGWNSLFGHNKEDIFEAQQKFEETIQLEPESSLGYALAAWAHWWAVFQDLTDDVTFSLERATELAQKAINLEDYTGLPHLMMAQVYLLKRQHDKALAEAEKAILARPSCEASFAIKANILNYLGRHSEAVTLVKYAIRLAPVHPSFYQAILASAYYGCKRYDEAIAAAQQGLKMDSDNLDVLLVLTCANAALNRLTEAQMASREVLRVKPDFTFDWFAKTRPFKDQDALGEITAALSKAGL